MMRDKRKNEAYFAEYIKYEHSRIIKKQDKLASTTEEDKAARIYANLFLYRMNMLVASFSYGDDSSSLKVLLSETCTTALSLKADTLTYSDALTLTSLSILLNCCEGIKRVIDRNRGLFESDKLLHGLASYIDSGKAEWSGNYAFPDVYAGLDSFMSAVSSEEKEDELLEFLNGWYDKCSDCAWYDTLNNPHNVYYGYWCFEAAALAKVYGLNEKRLSTNAYYPVL